MKKLYTMLSAALLTGFAASAFNVQAEMYDGTKVVKETVQLSSFAANHAPFKAPAQKAPIASVNELLGTYLVSFNEYFNIEEPGPLSAQAVVTKGESDNQIVITGLTGMPLPVLGTVDFNNQTLTIEPQFLDGSINVGGTDYEVELQHHVWVSNTTNEPSDKPVVGTIYEDGVIEFDVNDIIAFAVYQDGAHQGYLTMSDALVFQKIVLDEFDPSSYKLIEGEGLFQDGWVVPLFDVDQTNPDYLVPVAIAQNTENPNQFILVDPYSYEMYQNVNISVQAGYISFDITDPNCVLVNHSVYSGYAHPELGPLYFYNYEAWYYSYMTEVEGEEITTAEVLEHLKEQNLEASTYKDGVVSIPQTAALGTLDNPMGAYNWNGINMATKIYFPEGFNGVNDIIVENNNAPAEYYNLQGMKVDAPANGVYIRRKAGNVEKIYIK